MSENSKLITYPDILKLALPMMLASLSSPLINTANLSLMGRLDTPIYIGGVAIGIIVIQFFDWGFSFLRKGITGLTAQAYGRNDEKEVVAYLFRGLLIAIAFGIIILIFRDLISLIAFKLIDGSRAIQEVAKEYFSIRILAIIAVLGNFVIRGWLYGIQRPKSALLIRLLFSGLTILLSIIFVFNLSLGYKGLAYAALISQVFVFSCSILWILTILKIADKSILSICREINSKIFNKAKLVNLLSLKFDIFIRTILVYLSFAWFTSISARFGDVTLAANSILINLFWYSAYSIQGFSHSLEVLAGQAIGSKNKERLQETVKLTTSLCLLIALVSSLIYLLFSNHLFNFYTKLDTVNEVAQLYLPWLALIPFISLWCYQLDSLFLGAAKTNIMRNTMIASFVIYAVSITLLPNYFGNHGLWVSLVVFFIARGITLSAYVHKHLNISLVKQK